MESLSKRMNMKTLDEVIEELQYWDTCNEYPECFYDDEVTRNALNYLKEYKRVQNKIEKIALGNIEDTLDKLDNKPLSWDELKLMEGSPVWVEWVEVVIGGSYSIRDWFLIEWIDNNNHEIIIRDRHGNQILYRDGSDWQIYRKEHK